MSLFGELEARALAEKMSRRDYDESRVIYHAQYFKSGMSHVDKAFKMFREGLDYHTIYDTVEYRLAWRKMLEAQDCFVRAFTPDVKDEK